MPLPNPSDLYFSFDYGPIHFAMMNTEANNDMPALFSPGTAQYTWLQQDLAKANANRANVPWVVVTSHRPFYCSGSHLDCYEIAGKFRSWVEPLFLKYKVDLVVSAHRHIYQRTLPMANGNATWANYTAAPTPAYIINGAAGNQEHNDGPAPSEPWLAAQNSNYGYGTFEATPTTMSWMFYEADGNTLVDTVVFEK